MWREYFQNITLEYCIKKVNEYIEAEIVYFTKVLKEGKLASLGSYIEYVKKKLEKAKKIQCKEKYEYLSGRETSLLEKLRNIKGKLNESIYKEEDKKLLLEKIEEKISEAEDVPIEANKNNDRLQKWKDDVEEVLEDEYALNKNYKYEVEECKKLIYKDIDILKDENKIRELATSNYNFEKKKLLEELPYEQDVLEHQIEDIKALSDEDISKAVKGVRLVDGGTIKLCDFGEIPFVYGSEGIPY